MGGCTGGTKPCKSGLTPGVTAGMSAAICSHDQDGHAQALPTPAWGLPEVGAQKYEQGRRDKCDNSQWGVVQDFIPEGLENIHKHVASQPCSSDPCLSQLKVVQGTYEGCTHG